MKERSTRRLLPWVGLAASLVLLAASLMLHDAIFHGRPPSAAPSSQPSAPPTTVTLAEGKWKAAGIRVEPATVTAIASEVGVPGRIDANPDRRVEIRPRAPGVIRETRAALGQKVRKGDVLAVLDSPDIGTARLNLRGRQIELATARTERDWKDKVATNVAALIPELRRGQSATAIQKKYADRPLGSDRALLLQAYADFEIAAHEAEKTGSLAREKIVGEHPMFVAMHTREGAQAKFEAVLEQVRFDAAHEQTLADQKVRLAEAAVIDAAQRLRILGISEDVSRLLSDAGDVAASKASTGDDVTAYPIAAPFDGTIITKTAVPSQKAEANDVLFTLADLSTVWVMANIPESDLALLPTMKDGAIRVAAAAYPGRTFEATLLSVGAAVDPTTRTVPMLARTANPDDLLKLGMFVRIVVDAPATADAVTVPEAAVVQVEGRDGVFVPSGHADGHAYAFHPVKLGRESAGRRAILAGLAKGDPVVVAGAFFLKSELILQNETGEE